MHGGPCSLLGMTVVCYHTQRKGSYDTCRLELPIAKYEAIKCPLGLCCDFSSYSIKKKKKKPSSNEFESSKDVSIGPNASSLVMVNKPVIIIP